MKTATFVNSPPVRFQTGFTHKQRRNRVISYAWAVPFLPSGNFDDICLLRDVYAMVQC